MAAMKTRDYVVAACFSVALSLLGATLLKLDFSRSDFSSGDLLLLFSLPTWIYLFCLPFCLLLTSKIVNKRLSWIIPFTLVIVLTVVFPLVQRPSIFFWDSFRHGSLSEYIETHGYFADYTGYFQYPGTFVLSAVVSETLGLPILETDMLLGSLLNLLIACFLLVLGKLFVSTEKSWLVPTTYLAFSFRLFNGYHYSPQLIGLCLYVLFAYVCVKSLLKKNRTWALLLLVSILTLTLTHVFSAAIVIATVFCIYLCGSKIPFLKLKERQFITLTLVLVTIVLFVSWQSYVASQTFGDVMDFISSIVRGERAFSGFTEAIVYNPLPGALVPILGFYRYGIYGFFALLSFLGFVLQRKRIEVKLLLSLAVGVLMGGFMIYVTPATYGVGRILFFGGVIISVLSAVALREGARTHLTKRIFWIFEKTLPFLVIGTFLVSNFYYSTYITFMHPDEIRASEFAVATTNKPILAIIDDALILGYFAMESSQVRVVDDKLPVDKVKAGFATAELSLQYLPRLHYYYDLGFVENRSNLIYSNDLCRIYARASLGS